ncbi:MAG: GAF domain-containing protein [Bacteroidales bacterium]|nr:GAF domain-containing protein [Bacteroidales bacterium]MDT8430912.1 GAF domain-containing protein [Bacteroidales bacterium]
MDKQKKAGRYSRIYKQLEELTSKPGTPLSRMATIAAVLHHKMDHFFWTGFYLLEDERLIVGPYQGPVACQELESGKGVCWAAVIRDTAVIVPDVTQFPGHIACDARSQSEITLPVKDKNGNCRAVLDVDSGEKGQFDEVDQQHLDAIIKLIYI